MLKVVKYYSVFDYGYKSKARAIEALEGWEHKEKIYEEYVVLNVDEEPFEINLADNDYPHFRKMDHALEHIKEEKLYREGKL